MARRKWDGRVARFLRLVDAGVKCRGRVKVMMNPTSKECGVEKSSAA